MATDRKKVEALKAGLRALFRRLESRPVPDRLRSVVDQLDEGDQAAETKKTG